MFSLISLTFSSSWVLFFFSTVCLMSAFVCSFFDLSFSLEWVLLGWSCYNIKLVFFFDFWSLVFMSGVFFVASSVMDFSGYYMSGVFAERQFTWVVLAFVSSMSFMIFSLNLISLFLGWDGLGIISFLLVIFYQNESSVGAGLITALTNRLGDVFILLSVALGFDFLNWDFMMIKNTNYYFCFLLVWASMTKSAQVPFSAWLPAAMAAPTPVSALVHSSTLVTAGIYLLIRLDLDYFYNTSWLFYVGLSTACMSSISACFEGDLKKVVALSTLSQLGVMMVVVSLNLTNLALFHLISHAFFKALLFVCVGVVIHTVFTQDSRGAGSLGGGSVVVQSFLVVSSLSLCGLFFLSGFYSKDLLMEVILSGDFSFVSMFLFFIMIGLSSSYSLRLMSSGLLDTHNSGSVIFNSKESSLLVWGMTKLGVLSVVGGSVLSWSGFEWYCVCCLSNLKFLVLTCTIMGVMLGVYLCFFLSEPKVVIARAFSVMVGLTWTFSFQGLSKGSSLFTFFSDSEFGWSEEGGGRSVVNTTLSSLSFMNKGQFSDLFFLQYISGMVILLLLF